MTIEESRRSQRPYRYGMVLLCIGALINWLGLAENYVEPVRYVGVACIVAGALLICAAMCCWLHAPPTRTSSQTQRTTHPITAQIDDPIHVISIEEPSTGARQKPPDYEAVADAPPSYDDAIKLNPGQLARPSHRGSIGASTPQPQPPPPPVVLPEHAVSRGSVLEGSSCAAASTVVPPEHAMPPGSVLEGSSCATASTVVLPERAFTLGHGAEVPLPTAPPPYAR